MQSRRALITGVTGQDGAYLSKFLLDKGYEVHGLLRRSASADVIDARLKWLGVAGKITLHDGNLTDLSGLIRILQDVQPAEIYNLAAQSFVKVIMATAIVDRDGNGSRCCPHAGSSSNCLPYGALLSSIILGDVRVDPGATTVRNHTVLSALTLCRRKTVCALDDG